MHEDGRAVAYVSWAFVDDAALAAFAAPDGPAPNLAQWRSGSQVWLCDFIAPFGHAAKAVSALKCAFADAGVEPPSVHWVRRYAA
jgi:hemolysin-activating ACP:hemolysin acyltransferase